MQIFDRPPTRLALPIVIALVAGLAIGASAQTPATGTLSGAALDTLGARIAGATVTLDGPTSGTTTSGSDGSYRFTDLPPGRYRVTFAAPGFSPVTSDAIYVTPGARLVRDLALQIGPLEQAVVVTASASDVRQSQTGAPVMVIDSRTIAVQNKPDLLESLRLVPGTHVQQTGARGGMSALFVRGGNADFAKVLVDGVAVNDIGGGFDFAQFQTTGVDRIEILRQSNSVMYGSDALAGVVSIETRRGRTRVPDVAYAIEGGNLGTLRTNASLGGAAKRVDYFSEYSFLTTDNRLPNSGYRNHSFAGRFGLTVGRGTYASATVRHVDAAAGSPDGFALYDMADDARSDTGSTYASVTARSQWTDRWQSTVRYGSFGQRLAYLNPAPTGEAFDPFGFGPSYLGRTVTLTGANGYSVTGRGVLNYDAAYPQRFDSRATRRSLFGQTTYRVGGDVHLSAGARLEHEAGYVSNPLADPDVTRTNGGVFVEGRGSIGGRTHVSAGLGLERNAVFRSAITPRFSLATYLRSTARGTFGDTKLVANAGRGIKASSVFQQQNSLFELLRTVPAAPAVGPLGPERSESFDVGIEQGLVSGHGRLRLSYFRSVFDDLVEYVGQSALPLVGVPVEAARATTFGAYVNASSFTTQGIEASVEIVAGPVRGVGAYSFLDAEVTRSFTGDAMAPAINPAFPGVQIGQFAPLVGARPFRRPTHAGSFMISYGHGPLDLAVSAHLVGRRDGSTFLSDQYFGYTMLLPNRNLEAAYQKADVSVAYRLPGRARAFVSIENVLDRRYQASFGFPSLPITARAGLSVGVGGDR